MSCSGLVYISDPVFMSHDLKVSPKHNYGGLYSIHRTPSIVNVLPFIKKNMYGITIKELNEIF